MSQNYNPWRKEMTIEIHNNGKHVKFDTNKADKLYDAYKDHAEHETKYAQCAKEYAASAKIHADSEKWYAELSKRHTEFSKWYVKEAKVEKKLAEQAMIALN